MRRYKSEKSLLKAIIDIYGYDIDYEKKCIDKIIGTMVKEGEFFKIGNLYYLRKDEFTSFAYCSLVKFSSPGVLFRSKKDVLYIPFVEHETYSDEEAEKYKDIHFIDEYKKELTKDCMCKKKTS